ncbi:hypothetical protein ACFVTY_23390 [Streptomyces sp. NPDC058067]|uniref:hypothetical protein n=1 Tax=Streptomyces sp. NPDC058067 TaxID=3346324 RepID=UPI0036EF2E38
MATAEDEAAVRDVAGGVRDLLRGTGAAADSKWVRGLRQGRESNALFVIALHAAEKAGQGRSVTDLEQALLDVLTAVMTEEEIAASGAEYRAAVADLGEVPLLPTAFTGKPATYGFKVADLVDHLPAMRAENADRANCALVDVAAVAAGAPLDSEAFTAAVDEVGFGATMLAGPPSDGETGELEVYRATFQFDSFTCRKEVGDGLSGRDEIYWTAAARSDKHVHGVYRSMEFGAVEEGDTRTFPSSGQVVFDGPADKLVAMSVQVWEADHSNSDWYDKLHNALTAWLERPVWMDLMMSVVPGPPGLDVAEMVLQLFVSLKEAFRNKDDLSCQRMLVFERNALVTLAERKDAVWEFNGDGHHSLRVQYTGGRPVFPVGTLEYATRHDLGVVSAPVSMGWKSMSAAALAMFEDKLRCFYIRPRDGAIMWSTRDTSGMWEKPQPVGFTSYHAPAVAVFQDKLWLTYVGESGTELWTVFYTESGGWASPHSYAAAAEDVEGRPSMWAPFDRAPSLAVGGDTLYLGLTVGRWDWARHLDPLRWNGKNWVVLIWHGGKPTVRTDDAPSLAGWGDHVLAAVRAPDGKTLVLEGPELDQVVYTLSSTTTAAPSLVSSVDGGSRTAWLFTNSHGEIRAQFHVDGHPGWPYFDDWTITGTMSGETSLAYHNSVLSAMYRRG